MDGPILSAVVLPEPQELESPPPASSPTAQKRRQSSVSEQDAKRPRLNSEDATTERRSSIHDNKAPTKAPKRREGGRVKRLFGAALGALSQNSATAAQKRRFEIEKRQQAQRKLEDEEGEQRKHEREIRRKAQRRIEQKQFEKNSMRIRHESLLSMAHFLQTESEPRLYYKPWETTPEEDERIRNQIAEVETTIRRELDEYEALQSEEKEKEPQRQRDDSREEPTHQDAEGTNTGKESNAADASQHSPSANRGTNGSGTPPKDPGLKDDHADALANEAVSKERATENAQDNSMASHEAPADETNKEIMDENGEEIVEATEDTVIY